MYIIHYIKTGEMMNYLVTTLLALLNSAVRVLERYDGVLPPTVDVENVDLVETDTHSDNTANVEAGTQCCFEDDTALVETGTQCYIGDNKTEIVYRTRPYPSFPITYIETVDHDPERNDITETTFYGLYNCDYIVIKIENLPEGGTILHCLHRDTIVPGWYDDALTLLAATDDGTEQSVYDIDSIHLSTLYDTRSVPFTVKEVIAGFSYIIGEYSDGTLRVFDNDGLYATVVDTTNYGGDEHQNYYSDINIILTLLTEDHRVDDINYKFTPVDDVSDYRIRWEEL